MFVIAGVTGNTGKVAAETLLSQGKPVRVLVRDAAKGESWKKRGAEVAVTDLDDVEALTKALKGADGAYLLLPPNFAFQNPRADNGKRTRALFEATEKAGVRHIVFLSSVGAQHEAGTGPIGAVHDAEKIFSASKANVTFIRAAYFMENAGNSLYALDAGAYPTFLRPDLKVPMVATRDIVPYLVFSLSAVSATAQPASTPENWSPISGPAASRPCMRSSDQWPACPGPSRHPLPRVRGP